MPAVYEPDDQAGEADRSGDAGNPTFDAAGLERLTAIRAAFLAGDSRYSEETPAATLRQHRLEFGRWLAERVSGDREATHSWKWGPGTGFADLVVWDR